MHEGFIVQCSRTKLARIIQISNTGQADSYRLDENGKELVLLSASVVKKNGLNTKYNGTSNKNNGTSQRLAP